MTTYIEAYRADGSQVLGNLDGQASLKARYYRRTDHYHKLRYGHIKVSKYVHHWHVVDVDGKVLETIINIHYKQEITEAQKRRQKEVRISKHEGDDLYSWALFYNGHAVFTGMSRSEATWRRDRYISEGKF